VGIPRTQGLLYSPRQPLGIPFAITPIGQLHQSPPSPIPGDLLFEIGHPTFSIFFEIHTFFEIGKSFQRLQGVADPNISVLSSYPPLIWDRTIIEVRSQKKGQKKDKKNPAQQLPPGKGENLRDCGPTAVARGGSGPKAPPLAARPILFIGSSSGMYRIRYLRILDYVSLSARATGPARESEVYPKRPQMEKKPTHLSLLYDHCLVAQHS